MRHSARRISDCGDTDSEPGSVVRRLLGLGFGADGGDDGGVDTAQLASEGGSKGDVQLELGGIGLKYLIIPGRFALGWGRLG